MNRATKIRKGNACFNDLQENWSYATLKKTTEFFSNAKYQDGLLRVADFLYYEKHLPLLADTYYRMAGNELARQKRSEIRGRMIMALKMLIKK